MSDEILPSSSCGCDCNDCRYALHCQVRRDGCTYTDRMTGPIGLIESSG